MLHDFTSSVEQCLGTGEQELERSPGLASDIPFSIIPPLLKTAPRPVRPDFSSQLPWLSSSKGLLLLGEDRQKTGKYL